MLPGAAVLGLLALLVVATAGPVPVIGPSTLRRHLVHASPTSTASAATGTNVDPLRGHRAQADTGLAWIGDLLTWAVLLAVLAGAVYGGVQLWQRRWRRPPRRTRLEVEPLPEPSQVSGAVASDAAGQQAALEEGDARNGIVLCWLRLEEAVGRAGLPRRPAETSTEFTVRVLHALDLDPRPVGRLAALYREARFSEHALGEDARTAARQALDALHAELGALGSRP
jgi:hypothetical protein